jgi:hypothetical protein
MIADRRGNCGWYIDELSQGRAEQIAGKVAARYNPPDAARPPWAAAANRRPVQQA